MIHAVALGRVEQVRAAQAASPPGANAELEREFRFTCVDLAYHAEGAGLMAKAAFYYYQCADEAAAHGSPSTALEYTHKGLGALDKLDAEEEEAEEARGDGAADAAEVRGSVVPSSTGYPP